MTGLTGLGLVSYSFAPISFNNLVLPNNKEIIPLKGKRIGIIGLDTSHSEVFTRMINSGEVSGDYKVVAAYPQGSIDVPEALKIKPGVTKAVKEMGLEIVDSIDILLEKVDVILLESIDGRTHYNHPFCYDQTTYNYYFWIALKPFCLGTYGG